tara:strand:+ start:179 stop:397 length:219 start_codon:yes stop_codon:yes gene_type:complete
MNNITIVTKIARQVEGEYVFVNVLGAFPNKEAANKYIANTTIPRTETINNVQCVVEVGIIENIEYFKEDNTE